MDIRNYEKVLDELYGRVERWKADADIIRYQLSDSFLGGSKATTEAIIRALESVVESARVDVEMEEVPF